MSTEAMAYDGEGQRVALKVNGGTPTYYLGTLEEIAGSTLTKYLSAPAQSSASGLPTIVRVGTGGALSYLASDGLGSLNEVLDGSGNVSFQQLYAPYGGIRFTSGAAPTARFFSGQRWDSASGLSYYVARYYDTALHQFTSADTEQDGLNRYGYVHANPETYTDPTGHLLGFFIDLCCFGGSLGFFPISLDIAGTSAAWGTLAVGGAPASILLGDILGWWYPSIDQWVHRIIDALIFASWFASWAAAHYCAWAGGIAGIYFQFWYWASYVHCGRW